MKGKSGYERLRERLRKKMQKAKVYTAEDISRVVDNTKRMGDLFWLQKNFPIGLRTVEEGIKGKYSGLIDLIYNVEYKPAKVAHDLIKKANLPDYDYKRLTKPKVYGGPKPEKTTSKIRRWIKEKIKGKPGMLFETQSGDKIGFRSRQKNALMENLHTKIAVLEQTENLQGFLKSMDKLYLQSPKEYNTALVKFIQCPVNDEEIEHALYEIFNMAKFKKKVF